MRVIVIHPDLLFRQLLVCYLKGLPELEIVAHVDNGMDGLQICLNEAPDLVIVNARTRHLNLMEFAYRLHKGVPEARIVAVCREPSKPLLRRLLVLNLNGIILQSEPLKNFRVAIQEVVMHRQYRSPEVKALEQDLKDLQECSRPSAIMELTPREREVLQLIAEGYPTKEIGGLLGISPKTVDHHRARLMEKLDLHHVVDLMRFALAEGVVEIHRAPKGDGVC